MSGTQSPLIDIHHLEELLLFEWIDLHLHIIPLVQSLHINNYHSMTDISTPKDTCQSGNSKQMVKTNQDNPLKLGFYLPTWQAFLQIVKLEMWFQAVLAYPIPESQEALNLAREVLDTVLWTYHKKNIKLERDVLAELKKIIISIAKRAHNIFLQGSTMRMDETQKQITTAATKLLKSGDYLWLPELSDGKFKNFTAQALKDACLKFNYSNSKKALKNMDEFHQTIPVNAMLLVAAVLKGVISGICETSTNKLTYCSTFWSVAKSLKTCWSNGLGLAWVTLSMQLGVQHGGC
ncbi:uncharacterized protein BJ212DRAFT_1300406 [Suillus subaureus]|uniref:DUF6532 domain-containing protein n=1 Tax=Suillus subaureus TaxID=48587 RepID=A0A9P7E964_9AGAM|nr:uncharacterized protein BJ212DRAFT_1300406 [Suillus subaureus]KAG1814587.1 hypothetical protein BJ212DRAFT_1300406 [Suillus subaureus]